MGSALGISDTRLNQLADFRESNLFTPREKLALAYAEAMTITGADVTDAMVTELRAEFSEEEVVVLTTVIAWENASSKFNRALRVPSQQLWQRQRAGQTRRTDGG